MEINDYVLIEVWANWRLDVGVADYARIQALHKSGALFHPALRQMLACDDLTAALPLAGVALIEARAQTRVYFYFLLSQAYNTTTTDQTFSCEYGSNHAAGIQRSRR